MAGSQNADGLNAQNPSVPLQFNVDFDPVAGQATELAKGIVRLVAPNAGPYTFTGTNTYLIGDDPLFILDPGPDNQRHLDAIMAQIGGRDVVAVLLTHTHLDHSALARRLAQRFGAPLWFGGQHRLSRPLRAGEVNVLEGSCDWALTPDRTLRNGEEISCGHVRLQVLETPGHCANHLSFGVWGTNYVFSGDHVMGWNSTLVATPDGDMTAYFHSLDRLINSVWCHYLPAHGDEITDGRSYAQALKRHRELRNRQILDAVASGAAGLPEIVEKLYPGVRSATQRAAAMTVAAHVEHLDRAGKLTVNWTPGNTRIAPA